MGQESEFVSAMGKGFEIVQKLSDAVHDLGGSDNHLRRILSDETLCLEIAKLLVSGNVGHKTLAEMIARGCYGYVNPNITEQNFPLKPELYSTEGGKTFCFGKVMTTAQVEAAIQAAGYKPDPIEKLLAYGEANPDEQRKGPIVALGSSWVYPHGDRHVPFLDEYGGGRGLSLDWDSPVDRWSEDCRFLASPQVQNSDT